MLNLLAVIAGCALIIVVLWETFETIVLPRRVTRQVRVTRLFYRLTWLPWAALAHSFRNKKSRESLMSYYGPISLLVLLALWAFMLLVGFALIHFGAGSVFAGALYRNRFGNALYISGSTIFTLGLGDITPASPLARFLTVLEAGIGFGFLALVIGYLPVIYQSFSRRETTISLLDARAGSPATATELLRRHSDPQGTLALLRVLEDWERWSADLMESHLSYPVLGFFRSQHDNQSWLGSLTAILDTCSIIMAGLDGMPRYQAKMTFAMARHALVDLSQIFKAPPVPVEVCDRLSPEELAAMKQILRKEGFLPMDGDAATAKLNKLRSLYEPYALSLARLLYIELPPWIKEGEVKDNWKTSAWKQTVSPDGIVQPEEHF